MRGQVRKPGQGNYIYKGYIWKRVGCLGTQGLSLRVGWKGCWGARARNFLNAPLPDLGCCCQTLPLCPSHTASPPPSSSTLFAACFHLCPTDTQTVALVTTAASKVHTHHIHREIISLSQCGLFYSTSARVGPSLTPSCPSSCPFHHLTV